MGDFIKGMYSFAFMNHPIYKTTFIRFEKTPLPTVFGKIRYCP